MSEKYETYYVPEQSKFPLLASIGLFTTVFGLGNLLMTLTELKKSGLENTGQTNAPTAIFIIGLAFFCTVIWNWFATAIKENRAGMNSAQLKRSYVQGMYWFVFSEVMFFGAFFGALFYVRQFALDSIASGPTGEILWPGFTPEWPVMTTPDMAANGDKATMMGPGENMSSPGISNWGTWLPFWNTVVLITSSVTVHIAHLALKKDNKKQFNIWLGITVALGIFFLFLQYKEYAHAYHVNLTLESGIYGTTFFLLTGFHGLHVTLGTFMLAVQWFRSVFKGHFNHHDCFGFEASSLYWHFVDVVWIGLFIAVYWFG